MAGKKKKKAVTDLTSEDTLDYIYLSDAMYPRLSGQGCYQNTQQTISYETWKRSRGSFFGDDNLTNKKNFYRCSKIVLLNKSHSQKCSHRQESKLCCVKMSYMNATPNILLYIVPIKEVINKNPFVGMVILVHLSLVRRPYNLMPMIGNSFSFTALLNYFLSLLLLCKEVGLAEDKNFNIAIGHAHFFI